jgi:hypothetical protein
VCVRACAMTCYAGRREDEPRDGATVRREEAEYCAATARAAGVIYDTFVRTCTHPRLLHAQIVSNLQRLTELRWIDAGDNYAQLRRDVVHETLQYEQQIEKSSADLRMLRGVYRDVMEVRVRCGVAGAISLSHSIVQHHDFLLQQFDAYKQYLSNVRAGAAAGKGKATKRAYAQWAASILC